MDDIRIGLFTTLGDKGILSKDGHNSDGNPHAQYVAEVEAPLFINTLLFSKLPTLYNACWWMPNQRKLKIKLNLLTLSEITTNSDVLTINYSVPMSQLFACVISGGGAGYLRINTNKLRLIVAAPIPSNANLSADIEICY